MMPKIHVPSDVFVPFLAKRRGWPKRPLEDEDGQEWAEDDVAVHQGRYDGQFLWEEDSYWDRVLVPRVIVVGTMAGDVPRDWSFDEIEDLIVDD